MSFMELEKDKKLIEQLLRRDKKAAVYFYNHYAPTVLSYVQTKVSNTHEAEEIVQDTLFAFLEAIRDFHGNCRISTFLFSIAKHKIIDFYRKKKIKQVIFSRTPELENMLSPLLSPEESYEVKILKEKLANTFQTILPRYASVLRARYVNNMSIAEIAKSLATSIKSVEMTLFRARKAFIKAYEK